MLMDPHTLPEAEKELNGLSRSISEAVRDYRGANWEATIDRAGESTKTSISSAANSPEPQLPNVRSPIVGVRRYDAKQERRSSWPPPSPPRETCSSPQPHYTRSSYASPKEGPGTGRRVHGRAKASPRRAIVAMNRVFNGIPALGVARRPHICLLDTLIATCSHKVVANFLQRRSFCVAVDDVPSASRPIEAGVPQAAASPELYAVYTDDIPTLHGHLEDWEDDVMLALYADDSAYFASSRRADLAAKRIQRVLDRLPEWLDKWRMAVNVSKTAALLTGSQSNMPDQLRLRGQAVEWNTRVRYLGVHIDRSLRMTPQTDHVIQTSRAARAKLRPILASRLAAIAEIAVTIAIRS
ncbi:RNA-directed DNA polymerase from mobile element jockey [Eumeta japonica]|uniref:RNA-directed DNA polymerase from mobile element jockey n=1 Tax=Eumeta variegata TaxID=151549 RepID=A0A4C1V3Q3_EUMVA|nr:RNA-directed DNA polymerase from mobile element jockey [Eumeta japonica]